jgi:hypothetical protein
MNARKALCFCILMLIRVDEVANSTWQVNPGTKKVPGLYAIDHHEGWLNRWVPF